MRRISDDWYPGAIPDNVVLAQSAYVDSSYVFERFQSQRQPGLILGKASGLYLLATVITGPDAIVEVGDYTVLNGCYLVSDQRISIGNHCLVSWGALITDSWSPPASLETRRRLLEAAAASPIRHLESAVPPAPVTLEDNVWVGFDSVVLPGVTLGRGCVVACKAVVGGSVPPYAVVAGNPGVIRRYLEPDDDEAARQRALSDFSR